MILRDTVLDLLGGALFTLAQLFGGNLGAAMLALPLALRLILLPLNLHLARAQRARSRVIAAMKPELDRLRVRYAGHPERLASESRRIFQERAIPLVSPRGLIGAIAQWPLWLALFLVIRRASEAGGRFLWIRDLARPDPILAVIAAGITYLGVNAASIQPPSSIQAIALIFGLVTLLVVSRVAAGVGLYWAASGLVSVLQSMLLRRTAESA
jgi:YidC/Oxa1 family membrane protein insertase